MNNKELIRRLRADAERAVPDVRARVLSRAEPGAEPVRPRRKRAFGAFAAGLAAVAACLAIVLPLTLPAAAPPAGATLTSVYLKINPAIELTVENGTVRSARPLNRDGVILLKKRAVTARPVEEVCAELAAEAEKTRYLTAGKSITVCVSGADEAEILARVETSLAAYRVEAGQSEEALRQKAERYGIGTGKMQLIELLRAKDPALSEQRLAREDTDDLMEMLEDTDEAQLDAFRAEFEAQYRAAFGDFAATLKTTLGTYIDDVGAFCDAAEQSGVWTPELDALLAELNARYAALGQKYALPGPEDHDWEEYREELTDIVDDARETLEELADDPEDVYEDLFEDSFEDWLEDFKISMK